MKYLYIKLLIVVAVFGLAGCKEKAQQIGAGHLFSCAVHQSNVSCWGTYVYEGFDTGELKGSRLLTKRPYVDPVLSVGAHHYCVLDQGDVACFLNNERGQTEVPALSNPYEIASGYGYSCALDDTGLVCWGDLSWFNDLPENLVHPRNLVAGQSHLCVLDDYGTHCAGFTPTGEADPSPPAFLSESSEITSSAMSIYTCGLQDGWVCWAGGYTIEPPGHLVDADITVPGYLQACSIADGQVACWGDGSFGPLKVDSPENITNPTQLAVGLFHACVIADEGVVCWGEEYEDRFPAGVPPYL